jgi:hypothetical protein
LRSCAPSGGSSTGGPSLKVRVTAEVRVRLVRAWECQTSQSRQSRQARPEEPSSGAAKGTGTLTMLPRGLYCSRRSDAQPLALRTRCLSVAHVIDVLTRHTHTYIHTYIHTCIHAYIHELMHMHMYMHTSGPRRGAATADHLTVARHGQGNRRLRAWSAL